MTEPSRPLGVWPGPYFSLVSYTPQTGPLHSPDSSACMTCASALLSQALATPGTHPICLVKLVFADSLNLPGQEGGLGSSNSFSSWKLSAPLSERPRGLRTRCPRVCLLFLAPFFSFIQHTCLTLAQSRYEPSTEEGVNQPNTSSWTTTLCGRGVAGLARLVKVPAGHEWAEL